MTTRKPRSDATRPPVRRRSLLEPSRSRPAAGLAAEAIEDLQRAWAAGAVGEFAAVRLEILQCPGRFWAKDPIDSPAIEADPAKSDLQVGYVIAAQIRRAQQQ